MQRNKNSFPQKDLCKVSELVSHKKDQRGFVRKACKCMYKSKLVVRLENLQNGALFSSSHSHDWDTPSGFALVTTGMLFLLST